MTDAIRYEWVRIRTIRSTYWLSVIALVFGVGLSSLVAMGTHFALRSDQPPSVSDLDGFGPALTTQFASFGVPSQSQPPRAATQVGRVKWYSVTIGVIPAARSPANISR